MHPDSMNTVLHALAALCRLLANLAIWSFFPVSEAAADHLVDCLSQWIGWAALTPASRWGCKITSRKISYTRTPISSLLPLDRFAVFRQHDNMSVYVSTGNLIVLALHSDRCLSLALSMRGLGLRFRLRRYVD